MTKKILAFIILTNALFAGNFELCDKGIDSLNKNIDKILSNKKKFKKENFLVNAYYSCEKNKKICLKSIKEVKNRAKTKNEREFAKEHKEDIENIFLESDICNTLIKVEIKNKKVLKEKKRRSIKALFSNT